MKEQLIQYAISGIVGAIAAWIVSTLKTRLPIIETTLVKAPDWVSARLGIQFSDTAKQSFVDFVHAGCGYINSLALSPQLWREVVRGVVAQDPAKMVTLQKEVKRVGALIESGAIISTVENSMTPELKAIYNEAKENLAVKVITANTGGTVCEPEIRACVRIVAPAHKPVETGPVTQSTMERLIMESKERQAILEKK